MKYDGFGRQSRWVFPSKTSAGVADQGDFEQYGYDPGGNRTSLRKRDGSVLAFQYDALGRMTAKIVPERAGLAAVHTRDVYYGYDNRGLQTKARFDHIGGEGITSAYDGLGRLVSSTSDMGGTARTVSTLYDRDGNRTRLTHPDSIYVTYDLDGLGRPTWVRCYGNDPVTGFTYDDLGRRSTMAWGGIVYSYDPAGRLQGLSHNPLGTHRDIAFGFTYNPASQILTRSTSNDAYAWTGSASASRQAGCERASIASSGPILPVAPGLGSRRRDGRISAREDISNMRNSSLAFAAALLLGTAAAPALAQGGHSGHKAAAAAKPRYGDFGLDLTAMDRSVKPGDSFWHFVNGNWDKNTQIAADRSSAGAAVLLVDDAERQVRSIVEDLAKDPNKSGKVGQQVGDFYASWMDEAAIEAAGTAPLKPYLARIGAISNRTDLIRAFAEPGIQSPVNVGILPDPADPTRYIAAAGQGGLGLPNRDYYLLEGEKYDSIRKAYRAYVVKIQQLAGIADAEAKADRIIALETALAKVHWEPARQRDIKQIYNPMNRAQLAELSPQMEWPAFLEAAGLADVPTVIAAEKSAITETGKMLDSVPLSTWKDYLAFHFVSSHAAYLPKAFDQASFDFYSKTLRGVPQQRERWKRGIQMINGSLGEAVGRIYVERHYPAESNRQMAELIANLRSGLEARLAASTWMDAATKEQARAKLAAFDPRIGHPTKWIDYSSLQVKRGDLLGNVRRTQKFGHELQLSRLGKPVDRALWDMNPQEVNAYYNPLMNQITFPAAILQPPYFDPKADPAINYGSIGAIIGHEIGHGFDDQGRQFDATGRIRDWWSASSGTEFTKRAEKLGKQFDAYEPIPGTKINGKLTMGENIGDLGGLEMAYAAYRRHVAKHGEPKVLNGLTGDQRFFIAFGQSWRSKMREGALRERLLTDPHSPPEYRVNGIVRNVDAWYKAFNVKPGDKMYLPPEERVSIW